MHVLLLSDRLDGPVDSRDGVIGDDHILGAAAGGRLPVGEDAAAVFAPAGQ
jgi:hypothetical protein